MVLGDDGKRFRTRSGETVRLVELLDEARDRCRTLLEELGKVSKWYTPNRQSLNLRGISPYA